MLFLNALQKKTQEKDTVNLDWIAVCLRNWIYTLRQNFTNKIIVIQIEC